MFQQQKNIGLIFCYRWTELFSSRHFSLVSVRKASVFYCCSWYVDILLQIVFAGWSRSDAVSRIYLQSCVKCNVYTISKKKKKKSQANLFAYCENIIKNNVIELKKTPFRGWTRVVSSQTFSAEMQLTGTRATLDPNLVLAALLCGFIGFVPLSFVQMQLWSDCEMRLGCI